MKHHILSSISAIAMMTFISGGAMADQMSPKSQNEINAEAATTGHIGADSKVAWKDAKHDVNAAYEELKADFIGEKTKTQGPTVVVQTRKTATGIIGKPVYNEKGESVAKVDDIILDQNGKALSVVVADGELVGSGKKVAYDYGSIARIDKDGDVIMPVTEKAIDAAAPFSYDPKDTSDGKKVAPADSIRVSKLLDGNLLNFKGDKVADIDNIVFVNGSVSKVILGFDKTMGMGGNKGALNFTDVKVIRNGDDLNLQMSEKESASFDAYKKSVAK